MYEVRFAERFEVEAGRYGSLVEDAVARGCARIAANPARALSGFTIEVTDEARQTIFKVAFCRLGRSESSHGHGATAGSKVAAGDRTTRAQV